MSHGLTNAKRYFYTCTYYIVYTTKVPNIVTVLLVTVISGGSMETNVLNPWRWRAVRTCAGSSARFMWRGMCESSSGLSEEWR